MPLAPLNDTTRRSQGDVNSTNSRSKKHSLIPSNERPAPSSNSVRNNSYQKYKTSRQLQSQQSSHSYNHQLFVRDSEKARSEQGMLDGEGEQDFTNEKVWIPSAIAAAICFCLGNEIISIITAHVDGLSCIFYLSFGAWVTGIINQLVMSIMNYRDPSKDYIWHRNNLIVDGKIKWTHVVLFLIMCCLFFGIMASMFMTMYFSHMSGVNVGVITTIWSIQPLIAAFLDWFIHRQALGFNHVVGMILVILGAVAIGFSGIQKNQVDLTFKNPNSNTGGITTTHLAIRDEQMSPWLAIVWGFITPCFFLAQSFFTKFITQPKYNFSARTASFGTSSVVSFFVLLLGVCWFWRSVQPFDSKLFLIGIAGSVLDTVGKSFIQTAFSKGPAGPVTAFVEMNNVLLIVLDALRTMTFPTGLEVIGFLLGITGGLSFVFKKQVDDMRACIQRFFCCGSPQIEDESARS